MVRWIGFGRLVAAILVMAGCGGRPEPPAPGANAPTGASLSGVITIDGSSTVYPITEAVAEDFMRQHPGVNVTVGISGTGGGFKKFGARETDLSNASRPIKKEEVALCRQNGVEYIELPVAYDALTVVVHPQNTWAQSITVSELKRIWEPAAQGKIVRWNQIRPSWPDQPLKLYGPGADSGTFDYFTDAIIGEEGASRGDYTASEDDNVLVQGVSRDVGALGYFGLAYYEQNQGKLRALAVDDQQPTNGAGPVAPSRETIVNGTYQPLSRPVFIYVSKQATERPEVQAFVEYYLRNAAQLAREVGYVPLPDAVYEAARQRFAARSVGSAFGEGGSVVGVNLLEIYR